MSNFTDKLISVAEQNEATKCIISEEKAQILEKLSSHMLEINEHLNLTAIKDENGVILKHLVDSSACVPYIKEGAKLCDIGCGGGFAGTIQAFVKTEYVEEYRQVIDSAFGQGACHVLKIRPYGAIKVL